MTSFERARYARMLWNAPLSQAHAALLLEMLDPSDGRTVIDPGCGWAELDRQQRDYLRVYRGVLGFA